MSSYVPKAVSKHFVLRRMTMEDVKKETPDHRLQAVIYGFTLEDVANRTKRYFKDWTWRSRPHMLFGGYWVDRTLTGDREGECYVITTAHESDQLVQAIWIAYAWHDSDALYGFASRGGIVLGKEDHDNLLGIVGKLKKEAEEDHAAFTTLTHYIAHVPIYGKL
jgi:hypothetical protein